MKIDTFLNGELVESEEIDIPAIPNFSGFITQMMTSYAYNELATKTINELARSRLEVAAIRLELKSEVNLQDLELFKFIWDSVIESTTPEVLTEDFIQEWNQISKENHIPLSFGEDFKILIEVNSINEI